MTEIKIIWQYEVKEEYIDTFKKIYSCEGDWATFFKTFDGYIETQLLRNEHVPNQFITIDYWSSKSDFEAMKSNSGKEYLELDTICEAFTHDETYIGIFEATN